MGLRLLRFGLLATLVAAALAAAGVARTGVVPRVTTVKAPEFGIASEEPKWDGDGGLRYYSTLNDLGLTTSRLAITWDPARPLEIAEKELFDALMPQAATRGISVSLVITASHPTVFSNAGNRALLPQFLQLLARRYPQITTYVIGNEPNDSHFWRPQFNARGAAVSPAAFVDLLARSYDALKAIDPAIRVSAGGLVAHGNDNPNAPSHISISPTRFVAHMGRAYRGMRRTAPVMDEVSFHPYPRSARDPLLVSYAWPNAGIADLDRLKQAYWDAFHGTAQPTFEEGLRLNLDETGWQVGVAGPHARAYDGRELSTVTDEETQARIYGSMIRHLACDTAIKSVLIYRLTDDASLSQWQSGLIRADRSQRPAYTAVKRAVAEIRGLCTGEPRSFRHATAVVGARVLSAGPFAVSVDAQEDATAMVRLLRVRRRVAGRTRSRGPTAAGARGAAVVATVKRTIRARWRRVIRIPQRRLRPGWYVYEVTLDAHLNPARTSLLATPAFRVH